jgi:Rps23 Pro-64 3,4-dihydroxylase Tpa1-like proline 4-hydroxylase
MILMELNRELLREQYRSARPFPFVKIENFLDPAFAEQVSQSYPSFEQALDRGLTFKTVNERKKVQLTDSSLFPSPVARLNDAISSTKLLSDLSFITGIPALLADAELVGGGMHITGPGGRLDVHIDFNYMEDRKLHRRINLLLYLNPTWNEGWGGDIQLWDKDVKHCEASFAPVFNRCVIFETSEVSYHGVVPVSVSAPMPRQSFAAYYYTREAPSYWKGIAHSTIFKARPEEKVRGLIMMPAEAAKRHVDLGIRHLKDGIKRIIGR